MKYSSNCCHAAENYQLPSSKLYTKHWICNPELTIDTSEDHKDVTCINEILLFQTIKIKI